MKRAYPTIIKKGTTMWLAEVPDMDLMTEGYTVEDAIEMSRDAIGITGITLEDSGKPIPAASDISDITAADGFVTLVDIDFSKYRTTIDNKSVKKNITLPAWLAVKADNAEINLSRITRDALIEKLGIESLR